MVRGGDVKHGAILVEPSYVKVGGFAELYRYFEHYGVDKPALMSQIEEDPLFRGGMHTRFGVPKLSGYLKAAQRAKIVKLRKLKDGDIIIRFISVNSDISLINN